MTGPPGCPCAPGDCWRAGDRLPGWKYDHGKGRHFSVPGYVPPARPMPTTIEPPPSWPSGHDILEMLKIMEANIAITETPEGHLIVGLWEAARHALQYKPLVPRPNHT